jgi:hypothetical protein
VNLHVIACISSLNTTYILFIEAITKRSIIIKYKGIALAENDYI